MIPPSHTVLLVEDNDDDYLIVRDLLADITSTPMSLDWANSYESARAAFALGHYDVCLLDYRLDGHTGLDFLREFAQDGTTPVILLTGTEDYQVDLEATRLGAADYLLKGHINTPLLERSIRYAIQRKAGERALAEAKRLAQATVDSLPQIISVLNEQGIIVAVNQAWRERARESGFTGSGAGIGANYLVSCELSGAQGQAVSNGIRAVMRGDSEAFFLEYPCETGPEERWFELHVTRFTGDGPRYVVVAHDDISGRKRAEADLVASKSNLALSQEIAHLGSWEWDISAHENPAASPIRWSDEIYRILGYAPGGIKPSFDNFVRAIHPEDREWVLEYGERALREKVPRSMDHRIVTADGAVRFVHVHSFDIQDDAGKIVKSVGTVQDITERREAEIQRDRFFALSQDLLCISGLDGRFRRVNPAVIRTLGFSEQELLSTPAEALTHPDDHESRQAAIRELQLGVPINGLQNRFRTKAGEWRWLEWVSVSVPEEGLVYGSARDITERKETETALRRLRDELELRVRDRTSELSRSNAALQAEIADRKAAQQQTLARARQQEAVAELGTRALTVMPFDVLLMGATGLVAATLDADMSLVQESKSAGTGFTIRAGTGWNADLCGPFADCIVPGGTNSQAGFTLLSEAPVVSTDLAGETRFKVSRLLKDQGISSGASVAIRGHRYPFGVLSVHSARPRDFTQDDVYFLQAMSNVLAAAVERRRIEDEIRDLNRQLEQTNHKLLAENTERQMALGALREASEILKNAKNDAEVARVEADRAREAAELANRAKSDFLSRMSHELRTPLNAILGFGQLLTLTPGEVNPAVRENADFILKAGRHLLDLINEVLDIAKIEAGHLSLSLEPVEVGAAVREVLEMASPLAASRGIELRNEIGAECAGRFVLADHQRFKQVLLNYLSNAVKYNREGGQVVITWRAESLEPRTVQGVRCSGLFRVSVQDSGSGLTARQISRIFVPFERLGAERSQIEGTGIGLALCKQLVEAMHGRIGVESEPGRGSEFWLDLLLVDADPDSGQLPRGIESPSPVGSIFQEVELAKMDEAFAKGSRTILYIEDNLSNFRLVEQVLSQINANIRVLAALQGRRGLELARDHRPDLILLDINLPDMTGDSILWHLRDEPATRAIPVIVLSADATPRQMDRMLNAGASRYLTKPLDVARFIGVLREVFAGAEPGED